MSERRRGLGHLRARVAEVAGQHRHGRLDPELAERLDGRVPHLEGEEVQGGRRRARRRPGAGRPRRARSAAAAATVGSVVRLEQGHEQRCRGAHPADAAQVRRHGAGPWMALAPAPTAGRRRCRSPCRRSASAASPRCTPSRRRACSSGGPPAGRPPARRCAPPGSRTRRERSSRRSIAASSPSRSRQHPMRCSPRTRRDGSRLPVRRAASREERRARAAGRPAARPARRAPCRAPARRGRAGRVVPVRSPPSAAPAPRRPRCPPPSRRAGPSGAAGASRRSLLPLAAGARSLLTATTSTPMTTQATVVSDPGQRDQAAQGQVEGHAQVAPGCRSPGARARAG